MKKLFKYFIISLIFIISCKPKKEDPSPTRVDNPNITNINYNPAGLFQLFWVTRVSNNSGVYSVNNTESLYANFFNGSTFVKAGKVTFGGNELLFDSTHSTYVIWDNTKTKLPAKWEINGSNGYPSAIQTIPSLPDTFALTSNGPDSISSTKGVVLTLDKEITTGDSVQIHLYPVSNGSKQIYKTMASGKKTYGLTSSDLAPLSSGSYNEYILSIKASRQNDISISGKIYRFLTIRALEKSVMVK